MAEIVQNYQWRSTRGRRSKYPWEKWGDGQVWRVTKGTDFTCNVRTLQAATANWCQRHGYRCHTHMEDDDHLVIQVTRPTGETEKKGD